MRFVAAPGVVATCVPRYAVIPFAESFQPLKTLLSSTVPLPVTVRFAPVCEYLTVVPDTAVTVNVPLKEVLGGNDTVIESPTAHACVAVVRVTTLAFRTAFVIARVLSAPLRSPHAIAAPVAARS
jgi:hypothetical protein